MENFSGEQEMPTTINVNDKQWEEMTLADGEHLKRP